jgi:hypothetical protein
MLICPVKTSPEWVELSSVLGENEAWRAWIRNQGEYPTALEAAYQLFLEENKNIGPYLLAEKLGTWKVDADTSPLEIIRQAGPDLYTDERFKQWAASKPFGDNLLPLSTAKPKSTPEPKFETQTIDSFIGEIDESLPDPGDNEALININSYRQAFSDEVITKIADELSERLGVSYNMTTPEEAGQLLSKTDTPYRGEAAFFFAGDVYFVKGSINPETVVHEFSHPLIKSIAKSNTDLFNNLYDQVSATEEGQDIIMRVQQLYPSLEVNLDRFKEEVIVHALEKDATDKITSRLQSKGFSNFITNILYAIKQLFRSFFGKNIDVAKMSSNTSLAKLPDMLAGDKFHIDNTLMTEAQFAEFRQDLKAFMADVEKLQKTDKAQDIIDNFYRAVSQQIDFVQRNPRVLKNIREILKTEEGSGQLKTMQQILRPFQNVTRGDKESMQAMRSEMDYFKQQGRAFISGLEVLKQMNHKLYQRLAEINNQSGEITKDTIGEVISYNNLVNHWTKFVDELKKDMTSAGIAGTPLYKDIAGDLEDTIERTKEISLEVYQKFGSSFIYEQTSMMRENIDELYNKTKAELEKKKADPKRLAELESEYNKKKITMEKIENTLKGEAGDMSWLNAYAESFFLADDPIVGGFTKFIQNVLSDIDTSVQEKGNDFMAKIDPLLRKLGITSNPQKIGFLGDTLSFIDNVASYDKDGNLIKKQVRTLLNEWKDYRYDIGVLKDKIHKAEDSGNDAQIDAAWEEYYKFSKDYLYQELTDEFYAVQDKYKKSDLGKKAFAERDAKLQQITDMSSDARSEADIYSDDEAINILWREYNQLFSLTNEDGSPKEGEELDKANLLRDYRAESRKFYEYKERQGAFETALSNFEAQLEIRGLNPGTPEFNAEVDNWIKKNTKVQYTQEYYDDRNVIFEGIKSLTKNIDARLAEQIDIGAQWEEILDTVAGFRDQDGQPIATDMNDKRIQKIKDAQERIINAQSKLAGLTGLTSDEMETVLSLSQKSEMGLDLTEEEEEVYTSLLTKKDTLGLNDGDKADLFSLYAKLSEVQKRLPTEYYLTRMNYWANELSFFYVDNSNADNLLKEEFLQPLFHKSPEFEAWFTKNHIRKMVYNKETKEKEPKWERLYVWSVVVPAQDKYIVKTDLKRLDPITGKPMNINGVPTAKYFYRFIKPEFRTGYNPATKKVEKKVGKHIDIHGNPLPKTVAEGAKDDRYVNKDFVKMKKENPDMFNLLQAVKEQHLDMQKGLPRNSRLGYDIPRYRKSNLEYAQSGETLKKANLKEGAKSLFPALSSIGSYMLDQFRAANDDYQNKDLNYDASQNLKFVRADFFDNEAADIPITGLSDMDMDQVSLDLLGGMFKYMYSIEKQKKLLEVHPIAKALKAVIDNPSNKPKDLTKADRAIKKKTNSIKFLNKKGDNVRAVAFNALYEREFLGKNNVGFGSENPAVQKLLKVFMGKASFQFFALNITSGAKNMFGGMFQSMMEQAGGEYLNVGSLSLGSAWANMALGKLQTDVLKRTDRSLETQLTEIFDAVPGRFHEKFGDAVSRTRAKSFASGSWFMSPRKFMELQSQLQLFGAFMNSIYVDQVNPDWSKKQIKYINAWERVDGKIKLKPGIDKSWDKGGDNFLKWKSTMQGKLRQLQGNYDRFSQSVGDRYLAFRMFTWMRKFFISMFMYRWGKPRYNWSTGSIEKGFYRDFLWSWVREFKALRFTMKYMTPAEKRATRKVLTELGGLVTASLAIAYIFGYDDDDKERFEKLKKNPWLVNHALNLLIQVRDENATFLPLPQYGLDKYKENLDVTSVLSGPTLGTRLNLITDIWNTFTGDESAYYQRDVGPYSWQKEGANKFWNHYLTLYGITGSQVDPIKAIRGYESMQKLK